VQELPARARGQRAQRLALRAGTALQKALHRNARQARRWASLGALALTLIFGCASEPFPRPLRPALAYLTPVGDVPMPKLEGRVLLVKFLATWCLPCLTELASVDALQRQRGGRDFSVVAVGMDTNGARVLDPFARHYQLSFPLLLADQAIRKGDSPFGKISALPTTFLLDREGKVLLAYEGVAPPESLDALITQAIGEDASRPGASKARLGP